jgi:hypothetical protein
LIRYFFRRVALVAALVLGVLVTWAVAAIGFSAIYPGLHCGGPGRSSRGRVREIASGIATYQLDNGHSPCPTRDDLIGQKYVARGALVDSWGTSITFHCMPDGDVVVRSAGADRLFHTDDDITNGLR